MKAIFKIGHHALEIKKDEKWYDAVFKDARDGMWHSLSVKTFEAFIRKYLEKKREIENDKE